MDLYLLSKINPFGAETEKEKLQKSSMDSISGYLCQGLEKKELGKEKLEFQLLVG
jgi:hypothetical protein